MKKDSALLLTIIGSLILYAGVASTHILYAVNNKSSHYQATHIDNEREGDEEETQPTSGPTPELSPDQNPTPKPTEGGNPNQTPTKSPIRIPTQQSNNSNNQNNGASAQTSQPISSTPAPAVGRITTNRSSRIAPQKIEKLVSRIINPPKQFDYETSIGSFYETTKLSQTATTILLIMAALFTMAGVILLMPYWMKQEIENTYEYKFAGSLT